MDKPYMRFWIDTILNHHACSIVFPGWHDDERFGGCAVQFRTCCKGIGRKLALKMAKELKIDLEIEEGDHLEILKYERDYKNE